MSGDCYSDKNLAMESQGNVVIQNNTKNTARAENQNYKNMVKVAESKCSELQSKLERIKKAVYNEQQKASGMLGDKIETMNIGINNKHERKVTAPHPTTFVPIIRQNSIRIGTDRTGGALDTIKEILTGLVDSSHNRSRNTNDTKIPASITVIHGVDDVKISNKLPKQAIKVKQASFQQSSVIQEEQIDQPKVVLSKISTIKPKKNTFSLKTKPQVTDKNSIGQPPIKSKFEKVTVRQALPRIPRTKFLTNAAAFQRATTNDLVEIYHNKAVKETNSSDSNDVTKLRNKIELVANVDDHKENNVVPPLNIDNIMGKCCGDCKRRFSHYRHCSRNYAMPTISSRMKQAAKYYMNTFNIKCIPFCTTTSITPSHNIGINIQQVMNMVKNRQTTQKLSPTLAYNIALAAEKWSEKTVSAIITNMNANHLQCPLNQQLLGNYSHYQEMAKGIPDDIQQAEDEAEDELKEIPSPDAQSLYITGPSGDVKVKTRKHPTWSTEKTESKCTCISQKGVEFSQILNKYGSRSHVKPSQQIVNKTKPNCQELGQNSAKQTNLKNLKIDFNNCPQIEGKEQKLKDVITKLHDEFEQMNKRYEELTQQPSEENIKVELEQLDKELNSKEEEILMVMSLHKEVVGLKQQVNTLKTNPIMNVKSRTTSKLNQRAPHDATSTLLNRLLRQVQHFQNNYKRNLA